DRLLVQAVGGAAGRDDGQLAEDGGALQHLFDAEGGVGEDEAVLGVPARLRVRAGPEKDRRGVLDLFVERGDLGDRGAEGGGEGENREYRESGYPVIWSHLARDGSKRCAMNSIPNGSRKKRPQA